MLLQTRTLVLVSPMILAASDGLVRPGPEGGRLLTMVPAGEVLREEECLSRGIKARTGWMIVLARRLLLTPPPGAAGSEVRLVWSARFNSWISWQTTTGDQQASRLKNGREKMSVSHQSRRHRPLISIISPLPSRSLRVLIERIQAMQAASIKIALHLKVAVKAKVYRFHGFLAYQGTIPAGKAQDSAA